MVDNNNQLPTFEQIPPSTGSLIDLQREFAKEYSSIVPHPWQDHVQSMILQTDDADKWAASIFGILVPRQNGKNLVIEEFEKFATVILGLRILHTAHEVKTARKSFERLVDYFTDEDNPEIFDMVKRIRSTNGQEKIELVNGGWIEFSARSKSAGRGFTVDVLILDEGQELTSEQYAALAPVVSAAPSKNPLTIIAGTPPKIQMNSEVFGNVRRSAHSDNPGRVCWLEWAVDEVGNVSDPERWKRQNPSFGLTLMQSVLDADSRSMIAEDFAAEHLGYWSLKKRFATLVSEKEWAKCVTRNPPESGVVGYAVKYSTDGRAVSLSVALNNSIAPIHVEMIAYKYTEEGSSWLVDWLAERLDDSCGVIIDGRSGAGALALALEERGISKRLITLCSTSQLIDASNSFLDAIRSNELTHFDQEVLNGSVLHATRRKIGTAGAWGFAADEGYSPAPIESVALAYYNVRVNSKKKKRSHGVRMI